VVKGTERASIEQAVMVSQGSVEGLEAMGFADYNAWADAVTNHSKFAQVGHATLKGRLQYQTHFIGHLAA
jgi:hypothetical protein